MPLMRVDRRGRPQEATGSMATIGTGLNDPPAPRQTGAMPGVDNGPRLRPSFVGVSTLTAADRLHLFDLYRRYYQGMSEATFLADLADKDTVLLLSDEHGELQGFSTLSVWRRRHGDGDVRILFSGDTIIAHRYWGSQALPLSWITYAGTLKAEAPEVPLYWFLIVKGHRTYRFLPTFAESFYPDWRHPTPAGILALMHDLATQRFGDLYDPGTGVVRCDSTHGHLADGWSDISARELKRPDVAYFVARNPGYARGHELVCLCELSQANLKPIARRWFEQGLRA